MPETIEELVKQAIAAAQSAGDLPEFEVKELGVERPADTTNGDWSTTVAMRSARRDALRTPCPHGPRKDRAGDRRPHAEEQRRL